MKNRIEQLEIKNFKSLKHVNLKCKRINIFIGKPNVGKSNLLEALSLFCAPYSPSGAPFLADFLRYSDFGDLFYDGEIGNPIEISSNIGFASFRYHFNWSQYDFILAGDISVLNQLNESKTLIDIDKKISFIRETERKTQFKPIRPEYYTFSNKNLKNFSSIEYYSPVKKYDFNKDQTKFPNKLHFFLNPPFGDNLYTIVYNKKDLYKEISPLFKDSKLKFILNKSTENFELQKQVSGVAISHSYYSMADTLRRYIFYLMAIETNKDSILLFEEPEAHCFPPYIQQMSQRIIDSETNQFFITTHSPFVLNTILENAKKGDVAVFIASYKNFQTHITPLTDKELSDMLNYGYDIFSHIK